MAVNPATAGGAPQITGAIRQAAQSTGISFDYLLTTAKIESNLNPAAQASTSSAKGLYQFIDQTWLGTMKQDGAALGLGRYADAIARAPEGTMKSLILPCAPRSCGCAAIRRQRNAGGGPHPQQRRLWSARALAVSRPMANSISRIFWEPTVPAS